MILVPESCTENASKAMSVHFYLHFLDEMAFILFLVNGVFMAFFIGALDGIGLDFLS